MMNSTTSLSAAVHGARRLGAMALVLCALLPASKAMAIPPGEKLIVGIDETASEYWSEFLQGANDVAESLGTKPTVLADNFQGDQLLAQLGAIYAGGCDKCSLVTNSTSNAFVKAIVERSAKAGVSVVTIWNRPGAAAARCSR